MRELRKRPERRLTARGVAMRGRIVAAAADLVFEKGVAGTTLDDVMEASGASKSQLYHYFADKAALIAEVIRLQTGRVLAVHRPHLQRLDSMAALRRWQKAIVALVRARGGAGGCPLGSLASELADQSEPARDLLVGGFACWSGEIEQGLRRMHARGELKAKADPAALATAVLSAIQGGLLLSKTTRSPRPLELALDMALEHVARHRA